MIGDGAAGCGVVAGGAVVRGVTVTFAAIARVVACSCAALPNVATIGTAGAVMVDVPATAKSGKPVDSAGKYTAPSFAYSTGRLMLVNPAIFGTLRPGGSS
jgi:hypothetical protein